MMPEIEAMPILKNGKRVATVTVIYSNSGWKAHVAMHDRSDKFSAKLGEGKDLLGVESARAVALDMANKWRDDETKAGRF